MDRFIEPSMKIAIAMPSTLKSNMDRFIVIFNHKPDELFRTLKSNMDRFIAVILSWFLTL